MLQLGGPNWNVPLGRRDSTEAHPYLTEAIAPLFLAGLDAIILFFEAKGFTKNEFVALQGTPLDLFLIQWLYFTLPVPKYVPLMENCVVINKYEKCVR